MGYYTEQATACKMGHGGALIEIITGLQTSDTPGWDLSRGSCAFALSFLPCMYLYMIAVKALW